MDFSYAQAVPVAPFQAKRIHLVVVGLGGNGSALARHLACLAVLLKERGKEVELTLIDPDTVEAVNIPRQHFYRPEIGMYKVEALANRLRDSFPVEVGFIPQCFEPEMAQVRTDTLTVLVGCVDRAAGRAAMEEVLQENRKYVAGSNLPRAWYLDLGNGLDDGQLALGSTERVEDLTQAFRLSALGVALLPSPLVQFPRLRVPQPEELAPQALSCAQLQAANAQSPFINPKMATEAAVMLHEFLILGTLRRFSTCMDLPTGTMRSRYTTPEQLSEVIGRKPTFFKQATPARV